MVGVDGSVGMRDMGTIDISTLREGLAREVGAIPTVGQGGGVEDPLAPAGEDVELVAIGERGKIGWAEGATVGVTIDNGIGEER